ncbi:hypothetical protein BH20VER3_BH20VER3_08460 [soil metagenome]
MSPVLSKTVFLFLSACAWAGFFLVRFAERRLPRRILYLVLWPVASVWGLSQIHKSRSAAASWRRLSAVEAAPSPGRVWFWQALASHHARSVYLFPDRLPEKSWLRHCRLNGACDPFALRQAGRRIVFASLHFGPFETLPYWLRAHGLPVTTLVGREAPRRILKQRQYALSPPPDLPVVLPVTEKGGVRRAVDHLQDLLVMMDVNRGRQIEIPSDRLIFRLARGVIRIAAMTGAELIPCLVTAEPGWQFTIHFGAPVPQRCLGSAPDLQEAVSHLLNEFLPVARQYPAQYGHRLLSCIRAAENL